MQRVAKHEVDPIGPLVFLTVFPSIMLPMFLAVMDQTIVATALPAIAGSMRNVERISWVVVSYLIATTIAAPVYGQLGDIFGRRRLMFVALSIFMVASILCALAPNVELLTVARILQGLGGGGLMTLSQALVGEAIPPRERARYQGYLAAVAVCANTFGPVAGGYLTGYFGWRSIFLINVPIGLVALLLARGLPARTVAHLPRVRAQCLGPAWVCVPDSRRSAMRQTFSSTAKPGARSRAKHMIVQQHARVAASRLMLR